MGWSKNPSVMSHAFSQVPKANIERSKFDRSHAFKTTFDSMYLVPVLVDEVLPGDTVNLQATFFARQSTPIVPLMDNIRLQSFFFFVPNRLVWTNFQKFMGEQANPGDSTSYTVPQVVSPASGFAVGSLWDYMGIPTVGQIGGGNTVSVSALPSRCYQLIFNEWFRDENLTNSLTVDKGDGPDTYSNYDLRKVSKSHDYFTSCLPWPQKGTAVALPIGSSAPVRGIGKENQNFDTSSQAVYEAGSNHPTYTKSAAVTWNVVDEHFYIQGTGATGYPNIYADLTNATASTINDIRQAFQLQKLYERDARGGTRYTEIIRSHFGVVSPDARLQRPEYLGGSSVNVNSHIVPQTSVTAATPQGNLSAFMTCSHRGSGFVKSFTEHGWLIGLVCVRADLTYQQGINRMWSRSTRWDHYWPGLAHIGEQAVLNKEIYADGGANDALTFGYQERYAEYRYKPSLITGKFRSTASGTLDIWHCAEKFASLPSLGDTFIRTAPPINRSQAVNTEPQYYLDAYFKMVCARPMPTYSVPGFVDHF